MHEFQVYDIERSYEWNYEHAPPPPTEKRTSPQSAARSAGPIASDRPSAAQGKWNFCGQPVCSPLGIAAGPLLNGRWLLHYAQLGYGVLTYKTVRSAERPSYPPPNLLPIAETRVTPDTVVTASSRMHAGWAISFGMPSHAPEVWARDITWTRSKLARGQWLNVSVVASPAANSPLSQIAEDYAWCAELAVRSGADSVELNLSCPNVQSPDGQLFLSPRCAQHVVLEVRKVVRNTPIIAKIGYVSDPNCIDELVDCLSDECDALSMVNCLPCRVRGQSGWLFQGQPRGIGGSAIRAECIKQVERFAASIAKKQSELKIIGVGGIEQPEHVRMYLDAGAESTQIASAAITNPRLIEHFSSTL